MERKTCPGCGAGIDADHPHGLCPACLLKTALVSPTSSGSSVRCAVCQSALAEDARFCAHCGLPAPAAPGPAESDPLRRALDAKLQGQYRIIRILGRGGMGAVYLARDLTLEREVAIKVVNAVSDTRDLFERFRREAKTAAKLSHPNIVPLHAFGEVEGMPYFVMGYVRGESLAARLRREGVMPEDEARRILADVAGALDHAHRQGVVHRDVKPDNVLLEDESGRALLTDFGVARSTTHGETLTHYGSVVGTPHYMSPEQASGRSDIDGRSDLYSLGVMAYAMISGRLPFEGNTPAEILTKHLTQEPPSLRSLSATVSDATAQAVERCLAKDLAVRWPDARSLGLALGVIEESHLPDALQAVEGQGVLGSIIGLLLLFVVRLTSAPPAILVLNAGIVLLIYTIVLVRLGLEGFPLSQSQRVIWAEPSWWTFWYPRALRRRGNVWERLPSVVRLVRAWAPMQFVWFVVLLVGDFPDLYRNPKTFAVKVGGLVAMVLVWDVLMLRARFVLKRKGLNAADNRQVLISVPPARVGFWARPHIAALLAPAGNRESERRSDSPHDYVQAILRNAGELSGPLRSLGPQAAMAARQLVESIEHADRQLADLMRNVEPGEEERLTSKIAALTPPSGGGDEYAPLRSLLEKQLELVRGLSARIEEANEGRNRRVEMLKTLSLHLASLRARLATTPADVRLLSDNVMALCDDIARQTEGLPAERIRGREDEVPTVRHPRS